jgi:hypothetical protein
MFGWSLPPVVCCRAHVVLCCLCLFTYNDVQHVVLSYVFLFWVPCCDVRYEFRITMMFGLSLPPLVCRNAHVLFTLFVFAAYSVVQHVWIVYITWRELCTLREHMSSPPVCCGGVHVAHLCFVLLFVFTFWVPCCCVPYDFRIKHMFCLSGTSIILVYNRKGSVLYRLTLQLELKFEIFESIFTKSRQSIIIRTLLMKHF